MAQANLKKEPLPANGTAIRLKAGMNATADQTDMEAMLLLITNTSSGLAGANVYYALASSTVDMDTLRAGIPGPQVILQNWQGKKLSVTNISQIPFASMELRLYSRLEKPSKSLIENTNNLIQYQSIGDTLAASTYQISVSAAENTTMFVLLLPDGPITIEVNSSSNVEKADLIQTTNNSYPYRLNLNATQSIMVINVSKSPAARGQVKLLNLG
ncbi:MAG: hypothetical protein DHS20C18_12920 [Saprospiraceae bacterium]|nr:MAG: hypothetical protein DHS20C18_12920 [Saprospiraceae bacterium]